MSRKLSPFFIHLSKNLPKTLIFPNILIEIFEFGKNFRIFGFENEGGFIIENRLIQFFSERHNCEMHVRHRIAIGICAEFNRFCAAAGKPPFDYISMN